MPPADVPPSVPIPQPRSLARRIVWTMAAACGLVVANLYYAQPMLAQMAREFGATAGSIGVIATLSQVGYAVGLLFIVPLGDSRDKRGLVVLTLLAVVVALVATATARNLMWLGVASLMVGALTVVAQILVPFAAALAAPFERGRVVGTVMSGLLIGILLARTVSGVVAAHLGWRAMYWIAAVMMLLLALALQLTLPADDSRATMSYPALLRSLWPLAREEQVLRETSAFGALAFGAFSAFWVTLVFRLGSAPLHYGSEVAGLFGLVGVAGALAASFVGRLADRITPRTITGVALLVVVISYSVFFLYGNTLTGLAIGVILLDLGVQGAHISNQARIFALQPEARSRINTVYMVSYFIGGSVGSLLAAWAWSVAGWPGVCTVGATFAIAALVVWLLGHRRMRSPEDAAHASAVATLVQHAGC